MGCRRRKTKPTSWNCLQIWGQYSISHMTYDNCTTQLSITVLKQVVVFKYTFQVTQCLQSSCLYTAAKSSFCWSRHSEKCTKRKNREDIQNIVSSQLKNGSWCSHTICHIVRLTIILLCSPYYHPLGMEVVGEVSARHISLRKLGVSMDGITDWQNVNHLGDTLQVGKRKK